MILQSIGFFLSHDQLAANENRLNSSQSSEFRILCLGESTTTASFADNEDVSWPRLLEKSMNEKSNELGFKTHVFNEAVPGTNTLMISMNLEALLDKYRPHAVVTMMGINDWNYSARLRQETPFISRLQTYKVINYFFPFTQSRFFVPGTQNEPMIDNSVIAKIENYILHNPPLTNAKLQTLYQSLSSELKTDEERGVYHTSVAHTLNRLSLEFKLNRGEAMNVCHQYLKDIYRESEIVEFTFFYLLLCTSNDNSEMTRVAQLTMNHYKKGFKLNDQTVGQLLTQPYLSPDEYAKMLDLFGLERNTDYRFPWTTQESYHNVARTLKARGILYFPMIYPTGNKNTLNMLLSNSKLMPNPLTSYMYLPESSSAMSADFKDNTFPVGNENFLKLCKPEIGECYKDVWTTSFGGKFGHTTTKGHRMIAENLLAVILENKQRLYPTN